jgi:hypothetical protein
MTDENAAPVPQDDRLSPFELHAAARGGCEQGAAPHGAGTRAGRDGDSLVRRARGAHVRLDTVADHCARQQCAVLEAARQILATGRQ